MTSGEICQWCGIVVLCIPGVWSLFLLYRKKPRVKMRVFVRQHDHAKGLNACIHPVNELVVSIVNTSDLPLTIRDINFVYRSKDDQAKLVYDNFSYKKRSTVIGHTILKSQEVCFSLSFNNLDEKHVLDELEDVILVSSYGHKYELGRAKLRVAIEEAQALPPPDPSNLDLNFEPATK